MAVLWTHNAPFTQGALEGFEKIQPARSLFPPHDLQIELSLGTQYREGICPSHTGSLWVQKSMTPLPATEPSRAVCNPCVAVDRTTRGGWYQIGTITHLVFSSAVRTQTPFLLLGIHPGMTQREACPWWCGMGRGGRHCLLRGSWVVRS